MKRREFCQLATAALITKSSAVFCPPPQAAPSLNGFDSSTGSYATFCATPPDQRMFYELQQGRFVAEHLNDATWQVSPNSESGPHMPPPLPVPGGSWNGAPLRSPIPNLSGHGPYQPTWDSLLQYEVPDWYRDAKFGIWAHWGPQCVPEAGDWYARNMYMQGSPQYDYHCKHYGHPSRFGFKDLCPQWTLKNWQPDELIFRYQRAGAKFFLALANHHDNLDTWNSRHHPWNAMNVGPHRDVLGAWGSAARRHGLRFGVTVHQPRNWWWLQTAHGADVTGPLAGVPYDGHETAADGRGKWWEGLDPQRLYAPKHPPMALPDVSYVKDFYDRTRDLIDQHNPDLLYLDNAQLPLGWGGMNISAYFYNQSLARHNGQVQGVITTKQVPTHLLKALVADYERGGTNAIAPYPWQSETCIGNWHYDRALFEQPGEFGGYMHPGQVIHWLIDTVSKNGTFILNVPGRPDGTIDEKEIAVLDHITSWMQLNGEAIYSTRPWTTFGEGPAAEHPATPGSAVPSLGAQDIRFTRNKANTVVYAFLLGWPGPTARIRSFATTASPLPPKVANVELLGHTGSLSFRQDANALQITLPAQPACDFAIALKLTLVAVA